MFFRNVISFASFEVWFCRFANFRAELVEDDLRLRPDSNARTDTLQAFVPRVLDQLGYKATWNDDPKFYLGINVHFRFTSQISHINFA